MAVKILAVDDSATMRQILELTFAGEDAEVTTVSSGQQAVDAARQMNPDVVLADASMAGMDGYAVAQAIKADGGAAVVILSSQHTPYDEAKGKSSGVDDHVAKPFDSQIIIDKVKALASNRPATVASKPPQTSQGTGPSTGQSPPSAPTPARPPAGGRVSKRTMAFGTSPVAPPQPPAPPKPPAAAPPRRPVLELAEDEPEITIEEPVAPPPAAVAPPKPAAVAPPKPAPAPAPPAPAAAPAPAAPAPAAPAPAAPAAASPTPAASATASGGAMASKLADLGLSKEQVEGVLALSREVIEQVVWEVVPDLAETLIKEEIARLTKE